MKDYLDFFNESYRRAVEHEGQGMGFFETFYDTFFDKSVEVARKFAHTDNEEIKYRKDAPHPQRGLS